MTEPSAEPSAKPTAEPAGTARRRVTAAGGPVRSLGRRSGDFGRAGRGYTGWDGCEAIRPPRPVHRQSRPRAGWRRSPMAKSPRSPWRARRSGCRTSPSRCARTRAQALRLARPHRALNLWATWCVPCRKEMPALDALQAAVGGDKFEVVAINIDTRDPEKPLTFLKDAGVKHLAYYVRPEREGIHRAENGRQGLRHADDAVP